jgi:Secretion system C-terminal sorting domain
MNKHQYKKSLFSLKGISLIFLICLPMTMRSQTSGFTIPTTHPRLWWNTERLASAKSWYASNPFTPRADDMFANAFRYSLTGEAIYARKAIDLLLAKQLPAGQVLPTAVGCDECRYYGEEAAIVFDWCYAQLTSSEKTTLINRWNKYWSDVNQQDWGGVGMEGNNYYWGNLRNSIEWGIATFHDNTQAQSLLNNGLQTRWANSFIPYANNVNGGGKGGALGEGPQYGSTMVSYPIVPFISMNLMGRNIFNESNFYKEALINTIYSTTPSPIFNGGQSKYRLYSYNEEDTGIDFFLHDRAYIGDFMSTAANHWEAIALGQYARSWLNLTNPTISNFIKSVDKQGRSLPLSQLPLDYYASGLGIAYGRKDWGTDGIGFQVKMKYAEAVGHNHFDCSSFELARKGRWLTRETYGYYTPILGVNGPKARDGSDLRVDAPDAHNVIFVGVPGNMRSLVGYWQTAPPTVTRLESKPDYLYAALDMTDSYQSAQKPEIFENPFVDKVVREYIFIRPLESLIVFDRIQAKSKQVPANNVVKMALIHFEVNPVIEDANHVSATIGNQVVRLTTLAPATPSYTVVNEEGPVGQYRLQVTTSGVEQSYFINLLQGRDATGTNLTTSIAENTTSFVLTITHPTLGNATVTLQKGATSTGGSFGYSLTGSPSTVTPFSTEVANVVVTDDGPVWGGVPDNGGPVTGIEPNANLNSDNQLMVWPNPANSTATISFTLPEGESVSPSTLAVYNSRGQLIKILMDGFQSEGLHTVQWNTEALPSGVYLIKLNTSKCVVSKRVAVTR